MGFDEDLFGEVADTQELVFKLWTGRVYRVMTEDFKRLAWIYPPKDNPDYKANTLVFKPKLVMTSDELAKLSSENTKRRRAAEEMEILKTL